MTNSATLVVEVLTEELPPKALKSFSVSGMLSHSIAIEKLLPSV